MDFYKTFSPDAENLVGELYAAKTKLTDEIKTIEKNLDAEEHRGETLRTEITAMEADITKYLTGKLSDFQTFKEKLRACQATLQITVELLKTTREGILPQKRRELDNLNLTIKNKLIGLLRSRRQIADDEVNSLLVQYIVKVYEFETAFQRIFRDYGLNITFTDETLFAGVMTQAEIATLKGRIESERQRQALLNPQAEK